MKYPALAFLVPLSACSLGLEREPPEQARFLIDVTRAAASPTAAASPARLEVRAFHAASPFASTRLVYRIGDDEYETDFYREFLVAPERMLAELTRAWLADAQLAAVVLGPATRTSPTHAVEADVTALYGDFRDPGAAQAVVELRAFVVALPDEVLMQRVYRDTEPVEDADPDRLPAAFSTAVGRVLERLETDLRAVLPGG